MARAVSRLLATDGNHGKRLERLETLESVVGDYWTPFLGLPALRGMWLAGDATQAGDVLDHSGQARTLTYNGNPAIDLLDNQVPYYALDGTGDFFSRPHEAGLYVSGAEGYVAGALRGLTVGGWFYANALAGSQGLIGKYAGVQRAHLLLFSGTAGRFIVSGTGAANVNVDSAAQSPATWHFMVGRFDPSTEIAIFVDGVKVVNTTGIPATLFNGTAAVEVGSFETGTNLLTGRWALAFLCAAAHPDELINYLYARTRGFFGV